MEQTYGILLIGCGHIGMEHLMDIYYRPNISVKAVVDTELGKAELAAARCGAQAGTDYRPFLLRDDIHIVIVATYAGSHYEIVKDCLAHHKHVLCEKPIATSPEQGRAFMQLVSSAREKVLVGHVLRHNRSYQTIKSLVDAGTVGELRMIRMTQNHHALDWERYCRLMEDCSPTLDCGVHYYDLAQWLTNSPIVQVTGFGTKTQPDAPRNNYTLVTFETASGCKGFYEAGWGQNLRSSNVKEWVGTKGYISLQMASGRAQDVEEGDLITVYHSDTATYETINVPSQYKPMYSQCQTLIQMIEQDTEGIPTTQEVLSAFSVALAADYAVQNNTTLSVEPLVTNCASNLL